MNIFSLFKRRDRSLTPHWHHDFRDHQPLFMQGVESGRKKRVYSQSYKGVWIIFFKAPTPEDIKIAQEDFDSLYPDCEDCSRNLFVCTCMLELDGVGD